MLTRASERIRTAAHVAPSPRQLAWQELEFIAFFHFGVNTFTDREWGDGQESPEVFDPSALDARQWIRAVKDAGMNLAILTAKHHDGFCLWPSKYTEHSVKNSPYRDGEGDVVREFVDACRELDIKVGIYLSPWDRHERTYGSDRYNDHFKNQLNELLTDYGPLDEVWFDGACGEGPNGRRQVYDWPGYHRLIRERAPDAVIAIMGPDVRWVGNEDGLARETEWSVVPAESPDDGAADAPEQDVLMPRIDATAGDIGGRAKILQAERLVWYPAECDVSIRKGWFYHKEQDDQVKSPEELIDIYYRSVGRNSALLLNIPPDRRGMLHENDIRNLSEMRRILDATFAENLVKGANATSSHTKGNTFGPAKTIDGDRDTYWTTDDWQETATLEYDLGAERTFNVVMLQEYIKVGQRIEKFGVEAWDGANWKPVASGTTVGYKRLLRCPNTTAGKVRIKIEASRFAPTISNVGFFMRPKD